MLPVFFDFVFKMGCKGGRIYECMGKLGLLDIFLQELIGIYIIVFISIRYFLVGHIIFHFRHS